MSRVDVAAVISAPRNAAAGVKKEACTGQIARLPSSLPAFQAEREEEEECAVRNACERERSAPFIINFAAADLRRQSYTMENEFNVRPSGRPAEEQEAAL